MPLRLTAALLLCCCVFAKTRPPLKAKIDEAIANASDIDRAFFGLRIVSLADGRVLYERNSNKLFAPASNTKLFTTALALMTLGPDYRFTTSVLADGGDLVLVGGGDPSLSPRRYPYEKPAPHARPAPFETIAAIEDLADQVVAKGVRQVRGDIVGDDRRYLWEPYPDGWAEGDTTWEYGAPVSALIVNDNAVALFIRPGAAPGDAAGLRISPGVEPFVIDNGVLTAAGGERKITISRRTGSSELNVWGRIAMDDPGAVELVAVNDPAVFAARMLADALVRRGVAIRGHAVARHEFPDDVADRKRAEALPRVDGTELARRSSPPLIELLQVVDKVSQNLHAEAMLREVGAVRRNIGSADAGQEEMKAFLAQAGIEDSEYHLVDGSGLSRLTLVTPQAITKLLVYMYRSRYRDQWVSLLPVGGVDGTLRPRFEGHPEAARIQAKTGSLSHVRALSGYAESPEHGELAFSMVINNALSDSQTLSRFMDNIGLKLLK